MEIIVGNKLKVSNPTDDMIRWCKRNLIIDNPDFHKKERMGKWTGNTPRYIFLFEKVGADLYIPFGCLQELWSQYGQTCPFYPTFRAIERINYNSSINLYPYQERAAQAIFKAKNGVVVMPCGAGKTQTALEAVARIGGRTLWLTHTQDLMNQSMNRAKSCLEIDSKTFGTITGGKVNIGTSLTFATVQTMSKIDLRQYRDTFNVVIVDECMPGDTLIDTPTGKKALENLCIDDIITSYNGNEGKIENKRVTHIFKSKAHDIVKVTLSNGEEIICTKNHPIYTRSGQWVDAERLVNDDYVLRLVWKKSRNRYDATHNKIQDVKTRLLLLFKRMLDKRRSHKRCVDRRAKAQGIRNDEKHEQPISRSDRRTYEKRQPHEKAGSAKSGIGQAERNRTQATDKMWEWGWLNSAATKFCDQISRLCGRLHRISNTNKNGKRFRLSDLLQSRYSNSGKNDRNRNRWQFALCGRTAKTGQEKRAALEWIRVESVEVQEQTSDGTFGGMCCDCYGYNIEVEDNNNYFANGVLVHNCHHAIGSPTRVMQFYKVLSSLCARYKIGLTATPKRADGLERSMFALLGGIICEVSKEEVKHTTCPVEVHGIKTGYTPNYDAVLAGDGTLNYAQLVEDLTQNEERFQCVCNVLKTLDGSTLVLANRVEYLQRLCDEYDGNAICLSKLGTSKKAKETRKEALRKLDSGELDCIFATWQLAAEGLDCPHLKYVVFATPEKNERTVQQAAGRVERKAEGKDCGIIIDLIDEFGMYKGWWRKRNNLYKKAGYDII